MTSIGVYRASGTARAWRQLVSIMASRLRRHCNHKIGVSRFLVNIKNINSSICVLFLAIKIVGIAIPLYMLTGTGII